MYILEFRNEKDDKRMRIQSNSNLNILSSDYLFKVRSFSKIMEESGSSSQSVVSGKMWGFRVVFTEEIKAKQKQYISIRHATKIYFDDQFKRLQQLRDNLNINTDKKLAALLPEEKFSDEGKAVFPLQMCVEIMRRHFKYRCHRQSQ